MNGFIIPLSCVFQQNRNCRCPSISTCSTLIILDILDIILCTACFMYRCRYLTALNYATITNQLFSLLELNFVLGFIFIFLAEKEILTFAEKNDLILEEDIVTKKGKTTGTTHGYLMNDTLSFPLFGSYFSFCYTIENINDDDPFFLPGDSGSGVYVIKNRKPKIPLGIAFAFMNWQTAVCNISEIVDELGLQIVRYFENID